MTEEMNAAIRGRPRRARAEESPQNLTADMGLPDSLEAVHAMSAEELARVMEALEAALEEKERALEEALRARDLALALAVAADARLEALRGQTAHPTPGSRGEET